MPLKETVSKTTKYRRKKLAQELNCDVKDLPDRRGKHGNHVSSENHHKWNDEMKSEHGYKKIRVGLGHPLADSNGYAYEHLIIWCSSGKNKPDDNQVLHHINEEKTDNRIENLELMSKAEHNSLHILERGRKENGQFKKATGNILDGQLWQQMPEAKNAN